jgi:RNA polymerase sigma-70 factor, ECF subfamily
VTDVVDRAFRDDWSRVLAYLARVLGDLDLAEDASQEAFAIAAERWPREGVPANPRAWLVRTARNRAIDRIRRDRALRRLLPQLHHSNVLSEEPEALATIPDERLELLFACCHPALDLDAQVALTLRTLGGLSTEEIAAAFLVPAETMSKRLYRARGKVKAAGIPLSVPAPEQLPDRLSAVLGVVYLIFNEGYLTRHELSGEAIRIGRILVELMEREPEVHGLLALMLLNDARREARVAGGELVLLADQDRALWDQRQIAEGRQALERCLALGGRGAYALQAAIAELHTADRFDWPEIAALYAELGRLTCSPVVELNRAAAIAEAGDPESALSIIERLELHHYPYHHTTRGELLRRLDRPDEARIAYEAALELLRSPAERRFIEARLETIAR